VKRFIFLYVVGIVLALSATTPIEYFLAPELYWRIKVLFILLLVPSAIAWADFFLNQPDGSGLPARIWITNAVVLFALWSGGYTVVGWVTEGNEYASLWSSLDERFPLIPECVFIYLTVYFIYVLPLFRIENARRLLTFDVALFVTLAVSYATFIVFPVAFPRPQVYPQGDFSTLILYLVQAGDPAWNCFPSTHCATCTIASLALLRESRSLGIWVSATTVAIYLTTLLTRQHFVADAVAGIALGSLCYGLCYWLCERNPVVRRKLAPVVRLLGGAMATPCPERKT
jgi:hypothetical protein